MRFRNYDPERDFEAVRRIWHEVGWHDIELESDKKGLAAFLDVKCTSAFVAEHCSSAECVVVMSPGTLRHLDSTMPFAGVMGVTTSHIARKQGLAGRLTAHAVARSVASGAAVVGLGMFEQGFYNKLGFGSRSFEHAIAFDPVQLRIPNVTRPPRRLTTDDAPVIHANRMRRMPVHGAVGFAHEGITQSEMFWTRGGFGFGYFDGPDGELSHHLWLSSKDLDFGPYRVHWVVFETRDQLRELLGVLKGLGDQISLVRMTQPSGVRMQDILIEPMKERRVRRQSKYESDGASIANWQMRICDLFACLAETRIECATIRFNLALSDPIEDMLPDDATWRGCAGNYTVTLGADSFAESGHDPALVTMHSSVNAFTRLWLGVDTASTLAFSDDLSAPPELLDTLDRSLRLPAPHMDWEF